MASFNKDEAKKDGMDGDNSNSDSGYLHITPFPNIIAIDISTLNDYDRLREELEKSKEANEQLRKSLRNLKYKLLSREEELRNERMRLRSSQNTFTQLRNCNTDLLKRIAEYEYTIKVLESNEKILHEKLAGHGDKQTKELLEFERKKTKETEKELAKLKLHVQGLELEIEGKNELIDKKTFDEGELNKKLQQNANDVKEVKDLLIESKAKDAVKHRKIDDMANKLDDLLAVVCELSPKQTSPHAWDKDGSNTNTHQRSNMADQVHGRLPGIDACRHSTAVSRSYDSGTRHPPFKRQDNKKPPWQHPR